MRLCDYVVEFLAKQGVRHFFGYQGTMIAYMADAIEKNPDAQNHSCYNEQGAAFAASGAAKATGKCAVAYATSGPGATNLLSGIADAYYDSAPVLFITGQLNTNEYAGNPDLRQQGFQEMNVVAMVKSITKYCVHIENPTQIRQELERALFLARNGRQGPVLIDVPMNIQRAEIDAERLSGFEFPFPQPSDQAVMEAIDTIRNELSRAKRPVLLLGNGIEKSDTLRAQLLDVIFKLGIPVITSMLGRDILPHDHALNFGFLGAAYGHRYANLILGQKADLILAFGCRLCTRQIGMSGKDFASEARIVRIDLDSVELTRSIHEDELKFQLDVNEVIVRMADKKFSYDFRAWVEICDRCKRALVEFDDAQPESEPNRWVRAISQHTDFPVVCCDVGQHQVWTATSFEARPRQRIIFSGGHGAMGFALPAAIGVCCTIQKPVLAFCGDGAFQMNIQELQWVVREQLPILIFVFNNHSLGMITQLQDSLFDGQHSGTAREGGFTVPDFSKIASAYGIDSIQLTHITQLPDALANKNDGKPHLIEIMLGDKTWAYPKTVFGEPIHNPQPYFPKEKMTELLQL